MSLKISAMDFEMQYIKFGTGKKTLVILPGLSITSVLNSAHLIEKQYQIFCNDYTVYLFDRRENLPESYTVSDMANDTASAIKKLGLSEICLFGVSQGGMIAMLIAARHPELVSKLVLGSTACCADLVDSGAIEEWVALAKAGEIKKLCLSFGERVYSKEFFEQNKKAFAALSKFVDEEDLQRFIILASGTLGFDARSEMNNILCPVLAIGDDTDRVVGADSTQKIAEQFSGKSNFETYMYSGYGHAVYDTAGDYTQRLFAFFNKEQS